jgi:hypothetical protein
MAALRLVAAAAVASLALASTTLAQEPPPPQDPAYARDGDSVTTADWQEGPPGAEAGATSPGGYDVRVDVGGGGSVTLDSFQSGLSPYGDWVQSGTHGTVWRPRVAAGWRPYYNGRWEWTNEGWLWVSEEPFGWATYHYGRWSYDGGSGWFWVPGYQWAPAWVSWRYGGDVVGWAPLAPGLSLYVTSYAFYNAWWTFVPSGRFCGTPIRGVAYPPSRGSQFYDVTRPAPPRPRPPQDRSYDGGAPSRPMPTARSTPGWGGPPPRAIEERMGRPIQASRIISDPNPGPARGRMGEIRVYRPERQPSPGFGARAAPVGRPTGPGSMPTTRQEGRPMMPAPRQDGRPMMPAPRQESRPAMPAPRQEGRPMMPAPRQESRPAMPAPRQESRPATPAPRSSSPSHGMAPPPQGRGAPFRTR